MQLEVGDSLRESGFTHQQIMIIKLIAHQQEINILELGKELGLSRVAVANIVRRLELAGYVQIIANLSVRFNYLPSTNLL
jgi:DNA-binding MarR family transcriptional regulator